MSVGLLYAVAAWFFTLMAVHAVARNLWAWVVVDVTFVWALSEADALLSALEK